MSRERLNKIVSKRQKRRVFEVTSSLPQQDQTRLRELQTMPYHDYLLTPEWQEKRKGALQRAEYKCQVCNASEQLHTHHRTYERRGRELPSDLTVLCEKCHSLYHQIQKPQEQIPTISLEMGIDAYTDVGFHSFNARIPGIREAFETSKEYAEDHKGQWFTLVGGIGTGKTHLVVSIARACIEKGEDVRFISVSDLLDTFGFVSEHPAYQQQLDEILRNTDLLILDDLGAHSPYHNQVNALHTMLLDCYLRGTSVVVTTQRKYFDRIDPITMKLIYRFYNPHVTPQISVVELTYATDYVARMLRER